MTLLITVIVLLLLLYLLNKQNFIGGSKSRKGWDILIELCHKFPAKLTGYCQNLIYIDRQKYYTESECLWCPIFENIVPTDNMTRMLHKLPFKLYNSNRTGKKINNVGNIIDKGSQKIKKKNNFVTSFLLKQVNKL